VRNHHTVLTVAVPTLARPRQLARCLAGLAACDPPPGGFEVVVASGRPDPEVADVVGRAQLDRVELLEGDSGRPDGRNRAVAAARGDAIAFTDDDCVPDRGWLLALHDALERAPRALTGGRVLDAVGNIWAQAANVALNAAYDHFARQPADPAAFFATNNLALRRSTFEALGGFDPRFQLAAEDRDLCDRARRTGHELVHVPSAVVRHHRAFTLRELLAQQRGYGRGATLLRRKRAAEGLPALIVSWRFFPALVHEPFARRRGPAAGALLGATLLTQAAYAAGMAAEAAAVTR
jgi:GT2 family glycosyltransferase